MLRRRQEEENAAIGGRKHDVTKSIKLGIIAFTKKRRIKGGEISRKTLNTNVTCLIVSRRSRNIQEHLMIDAGRKNKLKKTVIYEIWRCIGLPPITGREPTWQPIAARQVCVYLSTAGIKGRPRTWNDTRNRTTVLT